jgi:hypothetical protein
MTRRLGTVLTVLVLLASGTYLLVYLYRWEWNRAVVAGIFFIAAEIALVATALLRKLQAIEARLNGTDGPHPLDRLRATKPEPSPHFDWLTDPSRTNVFVPVLLGAGVILSLLAHGVERLASATATPLQERALAARLDAIALPGGGLLGGVPGAGLGGLVVPHVRSWRRGLTRAFGAVIVAFLGVVAIQYLADMTQDRPDIGSVPASADIVLEIDRRATRRSELLTAEALYIACRHTIGNARQASDFTLLGNGRVGFTITPSFGKHAQRRFVGCLEDALFDRISASVASLDHHRP